MVLALAAAVLSVALGATIAVVGGGRTGWLGPARTFALVTAIAVVVSQLLPEAIGELGLAALGLFALGLSLPAVLERLADVRRDVVGLELGYAGLVVHKLGDGIAIGTFTSGVEPRVEAFDVVLAIAAHTVPVVALVSLVFLARRGVRSAIVRATVLGAAAAVGVLSTRAVPVEVLASAEPWITAAVAGMLMHVVFHDWKVVRGEGSVRARRLGDVVALAVGVLILVYGGQDHHAAHGASPVGARVAAASLDLLFDTAPWLLLGLAAGALLQTFASRLPMAWRLSGSRASQAMRGAVVGAPVPLCACGVLPVAQSLRSRGAGAALVAAFVVSTPGLGAETFLLTARLLGWPFAVVRLAATVIVAAAGALVLARVAPKDGAGSERPVSLAGELPEPGGAWWRRALAHFQELLHHVGPWMALALLVAAFAHAVLAPDALSASAGAGVDLLVVSLVAVPSYVCAAAATPLAAVLLAKGLSPAAVLAGLLLGPLLNLATIGFLRGAYGTRAALLGVGTVALGVVLVALGFDQAGLDRVPRALAEIRPGEHTWAWWQWASTVALGLAVAWSVWRSGLRGWLGGLGEAWSVEEHRHNHGHGGPGQRDRGGSRPKAQ